MDSTQWLENISSQESLADGEGQGSFREKGGVYGVKMCRVIRSEVNERSNLTRSLFPPSPRHVGSYLTYLTP